MSAAAPATGRCDSGLRIGALASNTAVAVDQRVREDYPVLAKAILAAVAGRSFHIRFDGPVGLQHANDVAKMFIGTARASYQGTAACNLRNDIVEVSEFVRLIKAEVPDAQITYAENKPLPFPSDLDDGGLRDILGAMPWTPLAKAIRGDLAHFRRLLEEGLIDLKQLEN